MSGFTLLEWCGVLSVVAGILVMVLKILRRVGRTTKILPPPPARSEPDSPPSATHKEKILVVDDDALVLEMMRRLLGGLGYTVVGVTSGEEAVAYMRTNGADLILLDLVLGRGMDGADAYRRIRESRPLQRVIVMSGYASPERVSAIRNLGVEHYLIKPVPLAMLARAIRTELDRP